jgi:parvulin-like peptidyl-prolyl isomerase
MISFGRPFQAHRVIRGLNPLFALVFLALGAAFAQEPPSPADILKEVGETKRSEVVGYIGDEPITRETLFWFASNLSGESESARDVFTKSPDELLNLMRKQAVIREAAKRAQAPGSGVSDDFVKQQRARAERILLEVMHKREIAEKIEPPSDAEIEKYYNDNKVGYTSPLTFSIRHIYISNYKAVQSKEGDTLESLAKEISGDAGKVGLILIDNAEKTPRAAGWAEGERATIKPLEPGERLLVPVSDDTKKQNRLRIEEARRKLDKGADFASIAKEYSENATKDQVIHGLRNVGKPMLPEVMSAAEKTPKGKYSEVFETKHGFNMIEMVEKSEEKAQSLEEAREGVKARLMRAKIMEVGQKFVNEAFALSDIKIEYAKIKNPETPDEEIILQAGEYKVARAVVNTAPVAPFHPDMSDEDVMLALKSNNRVRTVVLLHKAAFLGLEKSPEYIGRRDNEAWMALHDEYMRRRREEIETAEIKPEEAKAFFERTPELFLQPPTFTFYLFGVRAETANLIDGEKFKALTEARKRVEELTLPAKTLDDFKKLIREKSELPDKSVNDGLQENVSFDKLPTDLLAELQTALAGQKGRILHTEPYMIQPWLVSKTTIHKPDYDEIKDRLPGEVRKIKLQMFPQADYQEFLSLVEVKAVE